MQYLLTLHQAKVYADARKTVLEKWIELGLLHVIEEKYIDVDELDIVLSVMENNEVKEYKEIPTYTKDTMDTLKFKKYISVYHNTRPVDAVYIDYEFRVIYKSVAYKSREKYLVRRYAKFNYSGDFSVVLMEKNEFERIYVESKREMTDFQESMIEMVNAATEEMRKKRDGR